MDSDEGGSPAARGAEFRFDDGTIEIVFETTAGRVLTLREYPTHDSFERAVERASYHGLHEQVADLPDIDAFRDG